MKTATQLNLDLETVVETVEYNPDDGLFRWLKPPCNRIKRGDVAGHETRQGYWAVALKRQQYTAHRLAWFVSYEEWPEKQIRHLNGDKIDNRLSNLALLESDEDKPDLTQDRLCFLLSYNENTGDFTNLTYRGARAVVGGEAGVLRKDGYKAVTVDGVHYLAHRLAWLYVHGRWPAEMVDHVNGDRGDNRLSNLREAKVWQNSANSSSRSTSGTGIKGVSYVARKKKYTARVMVQSHLYNLGYFSTKEEAAEAIAEAHRQHQGEFARSATERIN